MSLEATFVMSAFKPDQLPVFAQPEVAFIGRSNVGKSSLLNGLLGRKNLARHSRTPGLTQSINFFNVGNQLIFADLPGYGYSATSRDVRKEWRSLIEAYLQRTNIMEFLFLVDCRRELNDEDLELYSYLSRRGPVRLVLTKIDKLSRSALATTTQRMLDCLQARGLPFDAMAQVSSMKKQGTDELKHELWQRLADEQPQL